MELNQYERELLTGWEEIYKKGQLTMWILLAIHDEPKHMVAIKSYVENMTDGKITADDKSLYRALRRYNDAEIVAYRMTGNDSGPDYKAYYLTETGRRLLAAFIKNHMTGLLFKPQVRATIEGVVK